MDKPFIIENARERERLRFLAGGMTDEELSLILYKEGWTIAVALAHLAFWDYRRVVTLDGWQKKGVTPTKSIPEPINDILIPFFLALPPRQAANLAVEMAEKLDCALKELPDEMITAIEKQGDVHALNRSIHRKMHLDEIEAFLISKRNKTNKKRAL
jgi:hypothetical protein